MAIQQEEPSTRDFDAIRVDAESTGQAIRDATQPLETQRRSVRMHLEGLDPDGDAWKAVVDERTGELDPLERDALSTLDRLHHDLQADREHLDSLGYRCGLPAADQSAADAKSGQLHARLQTMPAAAVARDIRGAVTFGDKTTMAAWALLADAVEQRFPNTQRVKDDAGRDVYPRTLFRDLLDQCQRRTGDPRLAALRITVETAQAKLRETSTDITVRRAAHEPGGNVGSPLLTYQFGMRDGGDQRRTAKKYDPDAVNARIGRST